MGFFVDDKRHSVGKLISQIRRQSSSFLYPPQPLIEVGKQVQHMVSYDAVSLFGGRRDELSHPAASMNTHSPSLAQGRAQGVDARIDQVVAGHYSLVANPISGRIGERPGG